MAERAAQRLSRSIVRRAACVTATILVELRIRANNGQELIRAFRITVKKAEDQQDSAGIRRRIPRVEADMMMGFLADMEYRPSFQFILRQDRPVESDRVADDARCAAPAGLPRLDRFGAGRERRDRRGDEGRHR